jgi:hypothetical protein
LVFGSTAIPVKVPGRFPGDHALGVHHPDVLGDAIGRDGTGALADVDGLHHGIDGFVEIQDDPGAGVSDPDHVGMRIGGDRAYPLGQLRGGAAVEVEQLSGGRTADPQRVGELVIGHRIRARTDRANADRLGVKVGAVDYPEADHIGRARSDDSGMPADLVGRFT